MDRSVRPGSQTHCQRNMTSVRRLSRLITLLLLTVLVATHAPQSVAQSVQWPAFRGNDNRTGRSAVDGPRNPDLHWSFDLQAFAYSSPAIDEDGTVVVGTDGAVVSVRPDGTLRWRATIGGNVVSSPLVSLGSVYIGARDGRLYKLNSTNGSSTSVAMGGEIWSSPIDIDGTVFFGVFGGRFFAVNQQDLSVEFSVLAGNEDIVSSPAVGAGLSLVFGSEDGNVYSIRPGGTIDWTFPTQDEVVATPAIGPNGDIRVGSRDGRFYHLNAAGNSVSAYNTGSDIIASAAVNPRQQSFFGDLDGRFHGVSASGAALWQPFQADTSIISSAVLDASGILYFGTLKGTLYALDSGSGLVLWSRQLGSPIWSSPSLGPDGSLYVVARGNQTTNGRLFAFRPANVVVDFVDDPILGVPIDLDVVDSENGLVNGDLFVRLGGARSFGTPLPISDGRSTIPASLVTERGLEYYVRLPDGTTFPAVNPTVSPAVQTVRVSSLLSAAAFAPALNQFVSVPLELDDPSINVLDEYGPYTPESWRLFLWDDFANAGIGDYREPPEFDPDFEPGNAYVLVTASGNPFTVRDGTSVTTERATRLLLQPNRWNQVGNPFAFPINWSEVVFEPDVVNRNEIVALTDQGSFVQPSTLAAWSGYFVRNPTSDPVVMVVPPREAGSNVEESTREYPTVKDAELLIRLSASIAGASAGDTENWIGFAGNDVSSASFQEAPTVGDGIRLSIVEGENRMAGSFKSASDADSHWTIEIQTPEAFQRKGSTVQLAVSSDRPLPGGHTVFLYDQIGSVLHEARDGLFALRFDAGEKKRWYTVTIGTASAAADPDFLNPSDPLDYSLSQNYPNPFADETTIRYQIPTTEHVEIAVYDLRGQLVKTLVDKQQDAGTYEVGWRPGEQDARRLASGVYICRMQVGAYRSVKRMVIVR